LPIYRGGIFHNRDFENISCRTKAIVVELCLYSLFTSFVLAYTRTQTLQGHIERVHYSSLSTNATCRYI